MHPKTCATERLLGGGLSALTATDAVPGPFGLIHNDRLLAATLDVSGLLAA
ncbi:hypothetical protein KRR38_30925 [Novosphingobium sp. G106]|uniref:hypothetical protein n=1 Tax=Novosphingobium sp. G106 TaxID=2849500 RepID=UPI001C2CD653|nr:hypothetical protein [Novosphingobium sp. G106]MBV1691961.1 hypothetical protein [Novosphingobium sp. G106]